MLNQINLRLCPPLPILEIPAMFQDDGPKVEDIRQGYLSIFITKQNISNGFTPSCTFATYFGNFLAVKLFYIINRDFVYIYFTIGRFEVLTLDVLIVFKVDMIMYLHSQLYYFPTLRCHMLFKHCRL